MQKSSSPAEYNQLYDLFKILGNKTRFEIFKKLMNGALCNCHISKDLGIPLNLVSHHVHLMLDIGLIKAHRDENDSRWIYYSICPTKLEEFRYAFLLLTDPTNIGNNENMTCSNL
jgi:ArsR family transcriptional regulator